MLRARFGISLLLFIAGVLFIDSCAVRRSIPIKGPLNLEDPDVINGRIHFMEHCQKCHPVGGPGLGTPINTNPFGFLKRFQARHGLGVMPSFTKREISDEEMDDIIAFLKVLRRNGEREGW